MTIETDELSSHFMTISLLIIFLVCGNTELYSNLRCNSFFFIIILIFFYYLFFLFF